MAAHLRHRLAPLLLLLAAVSTASAGKLKVSGNQLLEDGKPIGV
jgi:hypothetical protein